MGFFTICAGVVLLQLSKSAKDVPDTAVFAGDLDQVRTIAEQEQPESEPKADAIRGTAAIIRRFSQARTKMEAEEAKRLHDEKMAHDLDTIGEDGQPVQYEFDGLRRRRTTFGTAPGSLRSRGNSTPFPAYTEQHPHPLPQTPVQFTPVQHPPLGMSRFPDPESEDEERPITRGSSVFGRLTSVMTPGRRRSQLGSNVSNNPQSPMHPVPLTEIAVPSAYKGDDSIGTAYYGHNTEYKGAGERHITIDDTGRTGSRGSSLHPNTAAPTPPPHSARRQFSFQHMFRRGQSDSQPHHGDEATPPSRSPMIRKGMGQRKASVGAATVKGATEEERLGLVKGDTRTEAPRPSYVGEETSEEEEWLTGKEGKERRRDLTPPRREREGREKEKLDEAGLRDSSEDYYQKQKAKWEKAGGDTKAKERSRSPPDGGYAGGGGGGGGAAKGAFI